MKKLIYDAEGTVQLINDSSEIYTEIKPGFYKVEEKESLFFSSMTMKTDNSVIIPNFENNSPELFERIKRFFSPIALEISKSIGFIHKMGVLLYGKYGCGKTTFCYQVADYFIREHKTLAISVTSLKSLLFAVEFIKALRSGIDFKLPVVIIMDECENEMAYNESGMKNILDSNSSLDNCLMMFTTNYINKIPEAIKNRPSRIKECIEMKGEDDEIRVFNIFKNLNNSLSEEMRLNEDKFRRIVSEYKEATVDEIKHAFLSLAINHNENVISQIFK